VADDLLLLLDTPSLYYRAYFGVPESLTAPDGTPVNAVRGLLDFVANLLVAYRPARLVACFDADWRPAFRVALLPTYKAHRVAVEDPSGALEQTPDTLTPQLPIIDAVLDALGLPRAEAAGFEADDVIGTLTARATGPVDVVTGDRDLFQLIDDARGVRVLYTARGVAKHEAVDDAGLKERYGVTGAEYADFATLRGDPSDGLPGVAGVGEKTAATLVGAYGSLPRLLAAADDPASDLKPRVRANLHAARDYLAAAPRVVRVATDAPVPHADDRLRAEPADPRRLAELTERWNLGGSVGRVVKALAATATA
jgi:5'-3' exonuclease